MSPAKRFELLLLSDLVPDVSQSGGGREIKAAAPQKGPTWGVFSKHFSNVFVVLFVVAIIIVDVVIVVVVLAFSPFA